MVLRSPEEWPISIRPTLEFRHFNRKARPITARQLAHSLTYKRMTNTRRSLRIEYAASQPFSYFKTRRKAILFYFFFQLFTFDFCLPVLAAIINFVLFIVLVNRKYFGLFSFYYYLLKQA